MADSPSSSDSIERPLNDAWLPSRREGQVCIAEPPFFAVDWPTVPDPLLSLALRETGRWVTAGLRTFYR